MSKVSLASLTGKKEVSAFAEQCRVMWQDDKIKCLAIVGHIKKVNDVENLKVLREYLNGLIAERDKK